ncbi:hypothetical protein [Pseudoxanthomonas sp. 3HH-4]|uniref:alpha/beta hydrolase n=1 Tax=Pseudoxanthomonas sp. 3HH-4 TaxID=1690214 RepID=UPI002103C1BC|nr:hypothetical protein [Pseudoxanthomonas sp. 3HH-4]
MTPQLRWLSRINPFACGVGTDVVRSVALALLTWMLAISAHAQGDAMTAIAPPLFLAIAADDGLFADGGFGLVEGWRAARRPVEFHLYEQGGHGFGMYRKPTTSTGWFDAFASWMAMHGWLARVGQRREPGTEEEMTR